MVGLTNSDLNFQATLEYLLKRKKIFVSQVALSIEAGVAQSVISAALNKKRSVSTVNKEKIALAFNMPLEQFLSLGAQIRENDEFKKRTGPDPPEFRRFFENWMLNPSKRSEKSNEETFSPTLATVPSPSSSSDFASIPKVSVLLSAGEGEFVHEENIISEFAFRRDWLHSKSGISGKVVLEIRGDSMLPVLKSGDHVLLDTSESGRRIIPNAIYAVREGGAASIKILRWAQEPKKLELISANPDQSMYPPREIVIEEGDSSPVLGRVIWLGREL